jgi:hypothetical protein
MRKRLQEEEKIVEVKALVDIEYRVKSKRRD